MRRTDQAESLIRLAAPEAHYSVRAEADLARIVASKGPAADTSPPAERPTRRRILTPVVAVLAVVALAIGVATFRPTRAQAATPPMLTLTNVAGTSKAVLGELAKLRATHPGGTASIELFSWALNTAIAEDGSISHSSIEPTLTTTKFQPGGSIDITTVAAESFPGQPRTGLRTPGSLIDQEHQAPGQTLSDSLPGPIPTTPEALEQWMAKAFGDESSAGERLANLLAILASYPATAAQEAAVIKFLSRDSGIQLMGGVTDRLGRPGIVFSLRDRIPDHEDLIIISSTTGAIIASETVYVGETRTDITAPAVISYQAWIRH